MSKGFQNFIIAGLSVILLLVLVLGSKYTRDRDALDFLEREHLTVFYFNPEETGEDPHQVMVWVPDSRFNTGGTYTQLGSGATLREAIHQARRARGKRTP